MRRLLAMACAAAGLAAAMLWGLWAGPAGCSAQSTHPAASARAPADAVKIVLLHVNDVHGQTLGTAEGGGYARLATALAQQRADNTAAGVLFFHAGDELSRGDQMTRRTLGEANFAILNHLKLDGYTPGNGDYYDGADVLMARVRQANFPMLGANITGAEGQGPLKPFVVLPAGPVRVGVIGLSLIKTPMRELKMISPATALRETLPALRKQCDVVVVLSHRGVDEDEALAAGIDGIDVILGGHTHTMLPKGKVVKAPGGRAVLICQADEQLNYLGRAVLTMGRTADGGWAVRDASASLVALDAKVPQDPVVKALVARLWDARKVATATAPAEAPATQPALSH
jgi:2',3'-cyclic-nucleotide 2'-phosphodiesterase (5'-nucleotidase family)